MKNTIIVLLTLVISPAIFTSVHAELTINEDVFIKQYLPNSIMFFGNSTSNSLLAELTHPDGTVTQSNIAVNRDGIFSSSFYLHKYFEVGKYSITLNDTKRHKANFVIEDIIIDVPKKEVLCESCIGGTVTKIVDGDTIDIDGKRIRLALVNTPERGQPGYSEATDFTASLCRFGGIAYYDTDDGQLGGSYGRTIAQVYCNDKSLNEELMVNGHASIYISFCDTSEFAKESWAVEECMPQINPNRLFSGINSTNDLLSGINSTEIENMMSGIDVNDLQDILSNIDSEFMPSQNISSYMPKLEIVSKIIPSIIPNNTDGKISDSDTIPPRPNPFNSKEFSFSDVHIFGIIIIATILILAQKFRKK